MVLIHRNYHKYFFVWPFRYCDIYDGNVCNHVSKNMQSLCRFKTLPGSTHSLQRLLLVGGRAGVDFFSIVVHSGDSYSSQPREGWQEVESKVQETILRVLLHILTATNSCWQDRKEKWV